MSKRTDQLLPDQPGQNGRQKRPLNLPSHMDQSGAQIGILLSVIGHLTPFLILPQNPMTGDKIEGRPDLDGGVASAAVATFVTACSTIDDILT